MRLFTKITFDFPGDPFRYCSLPVKVQPQPTDPCYPSPCGSNAICTVRNEAASCKCLAGYFGDPFVGCKPECVVNDDCPYNKACKSQKCVDPCPGVCGVNAYCEVQNHNPICTCTAGYVGDAYSGCRLPPPPPTSPPVRIDPCSPSPCGPYSKCREQSGSAGMLHIYLLFSFESKCKVYVYN